MKKLLLAATALGAIALAPAANAGLQITSFGQTSLTNTVAITANDPSGPGSGTQTTISISDAGVLIDQLLGATTPPAIAAFMDLSATSIDAAVPIGPAVLQHYSGSFCMSAGAGCTGTIDLKGTFSDAAFGLGGGTQLSVNVANPPDTLTLTSDVVPGADLLPPNSFTLSMSNLAALTIDGTTIATDSASFSGVASANVVPEPASLAILGVGLLGLGFVTARRRSS